MRASLASARCTGRIGAEAARSSFSAKPTTSKRGSKSEFDVGIFSERGSRAHSAAESAVSSAPAKLRVSTGSPPPQLLNDAAPILPPQLAARRPGRARSTNMSVEELRTLLRLSSTEGTSTTSPMANSPDAIASQNAAAGSNNAATDSTASTSTAASSSTSSKTKGAAGEEEAFVTRTPSSSLDEMVRKQEMMIHKLRRGDNFKSTALLLRKSDTWSCPRT